jgi:two-component system nitrate/nitrite response regulator NarL
VLLVWAPMPCASIVIADRHPVVVCGLKSILRAEKDFKVVASSCDGAECMQAIRDLSPDIALLGMFMPGVTGLDILAAARSECLCTRVVLLTAPVGDRELVAAAAWGAYGMVTMEATPGMLVHFLRQIAADRLLPLALLEAEPRHEQERCARTVLTEREGQIIELVSEGLSNKGIGRRLDLFARTVAVHLHRIYQKLAINNRTTLAVSAAFRNAKLRSMPLDQPGISSSPEWPLRVKAGKS